MFADTGELLEEVDATRARQSPRASRRPDRRVHFDRTVDEPDQWTLMLSRALPLHKFRVDDEAGTEVYVSPRTAEVSARRRRRATRVLAWIGAIPHWLYFTPLRVNQPLWYWLVVWTSGLGCVLAVLGLVLGVTQFRKPQAVPPRRVDPVRGLDAVALHHRRRVRRVHADLGVQRPAVDGAVRVDQRDGARACDATC